MTVADVDVLIAGYGPVGAVLAALREGVAGLPGVTVHTGRSVAALEPAADHVGVGLDDGTTVWARWVVGCDGASSAVRRLAGLPFPGRTFAQPWLAVDVSAVFRTVLRSAGAVPGLAARVSRQEQARRPLPRGSAGPLPGAGWPLPNPLVGTVAGPFVALVRPDRYLLGAVPPPLRGAPTLPA